MTTYKFGDVILVPFPFTDGSSSKKRPAIVISSDLYDRSKPDLILIAVTSQVNTDLQFGEAPISDWSAAGLIKPSVIKPAIATIEKTLIIRNLGKLQALDLETLASILQQIVNFNFSVPSNLLKQFKKSGWLP